MVASVFDLTVTNKNIYITEEIKITQKNSTWKLMPENICHYQMNFANMFYNDGLIQKCSCNWNFSLVNMSYKKVSREHD